MNKVKELKNINLVIGAFGSLDKDCTGIVEKILTPKEGGIFTKYMGCNYLFKGYPDVRVVEAIAVAKKIISRSIILIGITPIKIILAIVFLFPKRFKEELFVNLCNSYIPVAYLPIRKWQLPPERYCVSVREIHRALTFVIEEITKSDKIKKILTSFKNIFCMILEYDYAYRMRLQDILPEIDIEKLKENPIKELNRILSLIIKRGHGGMEEKFKNLKRPSFIFLKFNKKAREIIVRFLTELNYDKIKLDEADWYYCLRRIEYDFRDTTFEERMKQAEEIDKKMGNRLPRVIFQEKKESLDTNHLTQYNK